MKREEVLVWLHPVKSWAATNRDIEEDPDGQWHKADLAMQLLEQTWNECVLGEKPLFTPQLDEVVLEVDSEREPFRATEENTVEVLDVRGRDLSEEAKQESNEEVPSRVLGADAETVVTADESSDE